LLHEDHGGPEELAAERLAAPGHNSISGLAVRFNMELGKLTGEVIE